MFCALGGALFERRHALGFEATQSPERKEESQERERSRQLARTLDDLYAQARTRNSAAAKESLRRWLYEEPERLENDIRVIYNRARQWEDEKAFAFVARQLLEELLERGKTGTAVDLAGGFMERTPMLPLGSADDTLRLAQLARAAGRRSLALRILTPFEKHFPGDARIGEVVALRAELQR